MSRNVLVKPVEENEYGFRPFYWGSSVSVQRKDGGTLTVKQALKAGGLDFTVEKFPLGAWTPRKGDRKRFTSAKDMFVTARTDTGAILGAVGKRYVPYQFAEGARFVSDIVDSGEAIIEVVGQSDGGQKGWIVCRLLGTGMKIGGIDENITPYLTIIMDHVGNSSVTCVVSPVRPPCANLLNFTIKSASHVFKVRHTETVHAKMAVQSGREALGLTVEYMAAFENEMEKLLKQSVSDRQFDNLLNKIVPMPKDENDAAGKRNRALVVAENKRESIRSIYYTDGNLDNVRGTRYGLLQAVVEMYQHETQGRNVSGDQINETQREQAIAEQRTNRLLLGGGLGQHAWNVLTR